MSSDEQEPQLNEREEDKEEEVLDQAQGEEERVEESVNESEDKDDEEQESDIEDVDEDAEAQFLEEEDAFKLKSHKRTRSQATSGDGEEDDEEHNNAAGTEGAKTKKKEAVRPRKRRADQPQDNDGDRDNGLGDDREIQYANETEQARNRRLLEERMDAAVKNKVNRRKKKDEDDIEMFQDAEVSALRSRMKIAAEQDRESVMNGEPALEKLKLLPEVRSVLLRANLADSILDNNLLDSCRIWLEPLPGPSLPAYEIQKVLFQAILNLPIKTIHLQESGLGRVMLFYQRSKKVEPSIKRSADKLIGDWTRPIMKRSQNYRDKTIQSALFDYQKFKATPVYSNSKSQEQKSLYEEAAARRKRAAAPAARTSAYKIAPKVNPDIFRQRGARDILGAQSSSLKDERFKSLSKKLNSMSSKKKAAGKGGISIEGKELGA